MVNCRKLIANNIILLCKYYVFGTRLTVCFFFFPPFTGNGSSSGSQPSPTGGYIGGGGGGSGGGGHGGPGGMGQHVGNSPTPSSTPVSCDMSPVPPVHHSSSGVSGSPPGVAWDMKPPNLQALAGNPHHHSHHPTAGYMPQYSWYQADGPNQGLLS